MYSQVILVTGAREWADKDLIYNTLKEYIFASGGLRYTDAKSVLLIHGACRGADNIAGDAANRLGFTVSFKPANWKEYGRAAGVIRNLEMIKLAKEYSDKGIPVIVLAFHDDLSKSKGTKHCVEMSIKNGLETKVFGH